MACSKLISKKLDGNLKIMQSQKNLTIFKVNIHVKIRVPQLNEVYMASDFSKLRFLKQEKIVGLDQF